MPDQPTLGTFGEPPEEIDDGVLLFDPESYVPIEGDPDFVPGPPPPRSHAALIGGGALALAALAFFAYQSIQAPAIENGAELPEMIPSLIGGGAISEALVPLPAATIEGTVGSSPRIGVRAAGQAGAPLGDTVVHFEVESGSGVLAETDVRTNADGIATTVLALPSEPDVTVVLATIRGTTIAEGRIEVDAIPGAPELMSVISGDRQSAEVGELLPTRVFISVSDALGNPVPNAAIRFQVTTGEGQTAPSQTRTDSLGQASALWRLGMNDGGQRLTASSLGFPAAVTFTATARPRTTVDPNDLATLETRPIVVARTSFTIGGSFVCELEAGLLRCRGGNDRGQTSTQGGTNFVAITAGVSHLCGLSAAGIASCWGANDGGQLGGGTGADRPAPSIVRTDLRFSSLVAGSAHTCGLSGGGVPICWGLNLSGQLGDGTRNDHDVPRTVGGGLAFRQLAAGWSHTCGLTANDNVFCWGDNSQGQLGDGSRLDRLVPNLVRGHVETMVAGSAHTCGISERQVLCWGSNSFGQLGDGSTEDRSQPVEVLGLPGAPTHLAGGAVHVCALVSGGQAYCWGQNFQGQVGDGTTQNRVRAVAVSGGYRFTQIYAGGAETCGITVDGTQYCWGLNQSGQLGDGTRVSRSTPTRVAR